MAEVPFVSPAKFVKTGIVVALILLAVLVAEPLNAQTNSSWIDGTGNWSNAANWDNGVPNGNFNAFITNPNPGPAKVSLDINATVNNLSLDGNGTSLDILAGKTLTIQNGGSISNNGTGGINLSGGTISAGTGTLFLEGFSSLTGTGTIEASILRNDSVISLQQGNALLVKGNVVNDSILGSGIGVGSGASMTITGSLTNQGNAQVNGGTLTVMGDVLNQRDEGARLFLSNGGVLNVNGTFNNTPLVVNSDLIANSGSVVTVAGDFNNVAGAGTFGAEVIFDGGSVLNVKGNLNNVNVSAIFAPSLDFTNGSTFTVQKDLNTSGMVSLATGSAGTVGGALNNSGSVQIDSTSVLTVKSGFNQIAGTTTVDGLLNAGGKGVSVQGGTLSGTGVVNGNVLMAGTMRPGESTGVFTINGNYTQTSAGTLMDQVGPLSGTNATLLRVNGVANLNGTLSLSLLNGYDPTAGDSFIIMTFLRDFGTFNTVTGVNLGEGLFLEVNYEAHDILVEVESNPIGTPEPSSALLLLAGIIAILATVSIRRAVKMAGA